jgi:hypothetical protein
MTQRTEIVTAIKIGAAIGIAVMFASLASAGFWYGSDITPFVIILAPGGLVSLFYPANSNVYWTFFAIIQIAYYSCLVYLLKKFLNSFHSKRGKNAG